MFIIKEFDEKYNKKINDFIISIYVEEFGFEQHRKELEENDNSVYVKNGGEVLFAIDENDNIIGTIALVKHNNQNVELKKFYVRSDYRGKGLSKELYQKALTICRNNGFQRIFLCTYDKLETAINFYLKRRLQRNKRNNCRRWS